MNRPAGETSPHLRPHAGNLVEWYPWGPEALKRTRRRAWDGVPAVWVWSDQACQAPATEPEARVAILPGVD